MTTLWAAAILMSVEVFDAPELTREVRVSQTGTIGIPLVPVRLYVVGLTELQVQQKISQVLEANGLVSHPQVMVSVKEKRSKPIAVVEWLGHPMVFQADRPVTLIEVLAEAGGIGNDAGDTVIITRQESIDNPAAVVAAGHRAGRRCARDKSFNRAFRASFSAKWRYKSGAKKNPRTSHLAKLRRPPPLSLKHCRGVNLTPGLRRSITRLCLYPIPSPSIFPNFWSAVIPKTTFLCRPATL